MSKEVYWVETTEEVFFAIYMKHKKEMCVFGTLTCPEGDARLGVNNPYILTEYGFERSDFPLIKFEKTKINLEQKKWIKSYFIAYLREESDD